jgi:adenylate kinase
MCGGELITREDDTEEALAVRLRDYHDQTNPVLEIFRRKADPVQLVVDSA